MLLQTRSAGMGEEPEDLGSRSPPSSSSAGRVPVGSVIPHPAPPSSCSAPRRHISHRCRPGKGLRLRPQRLPALRFPVPGGPTQGTSPHPFVPAREFFAVSGRRHGAREEGVSASRWDRGKAGACQPSFRPDPSPEQLHILPGALRDPESPALNIPLLPAAPSSPAPRGRSLHLPAAAPGPWIYTCRRAALPWPAGRPPRWPP